MARAHARNQLSKRKFKATDINPDVQINGKQKTYHKMMAPVPLVEEQPSNLPCEYCGRPVNPSAMPRPVVIEEGEPSKVAHHDCHTKAAVKVKNVPLPQIADALECEYCKLPVNEVCPFVLEWGKKAPGTPDFLGRPAKRVAHTTCHNEARGVKTSTNSSPAATPTSPKKTTEKRESNPSRSTGGSLAGKTLHKKREDNPRKAGTHGHRSWELVKNGMTYEAYIKAGGRPNDLRWDLERGWIEAR